MGLRHTLSHALSTLRLERKASRRWCELLLLVLNHTKTSWNDELQNIMYIGLDRVASRMRVDRIALKVLGGGIHVCPQLVGHIELWR